MGILTRVSWRNRWRFWCLTRNVWHWFVRSYLRWVIWIRWVLWRWDIRNWLTIWINGDNLPIWCVGNRDFLSQVVWRNGRATSTSLISVVTLDNWRSNLAEGVASDAPTRVLDDLARDVVKGDRLGEVEALRVVGRRLVTGANVVDRLGTSLL